MSDGFVAAMVLYVPPILMSLVLIKRIRSLSRVPTLYVVLDGGLVQTVCSDEHVQAVVVVVDYDVEGETPDRLTQVSQNDLDTGEHMTWASAYVHVWDIDKAAITIPDLGS